MLEQKLISESYWMNLCLSYVHVLNLRLTTSIGIEINIQFNISVAMAITILHLATPSIVEVDHAQWVDVSANNHDVTLP